MNIATTAHLSLVFCVELDDQKHFSEAVARKRKRQATHAQHLQRSTDCTTLIKRRRILMATKTPFQLSAIQAQVPTAAATAAQVATEAKVPATTQEPAMDLYRTFSPSEVAFWDLKCAFAGVGNGPNAPATASPSWSSWLFGK
jgi:hypothetical protein